MSTDYAITLLNKGHTLVNMAGQTKGKDAISLLVQAIDYCDASMSILDVDTMAAKYAFAQQTKGLAYYQLAELFEGINGINFFKQAIACYDIALQIRDRTSMAPLHANTQINKGVALHALAERQVGVKGEALFEQAITCYDVAIDIFDRTTDAFYYATAQQNKANTLRTLAERRTDVEGVALLEQAIACCDTALTIPNAVATPLLQASILLNKGAVLEALAEKQGGQKKVRGLEQAIECLDVVLTLCNDSTVTSPYASAQMNKGNALRSLAELRPEAEAVSLFKQAIACYDAALAVRDRTSMAPHHAKIQLNKGDTLLLLARRLTGSEVILLVEQAIECFNVVLEIYDSTTMTLQHAEVQMRRGQALQVLVASHPLPTQQARDKALFRLKQAIECFNVALEIYNSTYMASRCAEIQVNKWQTLMEMMEFCEGIEKKSETLQTHQELLLSDKLVEDLFRRADFFRQQGNVPAALSTERSLAFLIDTRQHGINAACNDFETRQAVDKQIGQLANLVNTYFSLAQLPDATDKQMQFVGQDKEIWLSDTNLELLQSALAQAQGTHLVSTATQLERLSEMFGAVHELAISLATLDAFGDVVEAKTWQDLQSILEKTLNYVSSDEHLAWLRNSINASRASGKTKEAEDTEGYFHLLYDARFSGIEEACKRFKMLHKHSMVQRLEINDILPSLLNTSDASAVFQILQEHEELFHSDLAIECIRVNIEEYKKRDETDIISYFEQYLHLLEDLKEHDLTIA